MSTDSFVSVYEQIMTSNSAEEALAASGQHPADRVATAMVSRISDAKRFSTLQARAALSGITLQRIDGDNCQPEYIATIGAVTTRLDTLDEAEAWIERATCVLEMH